MMRPSCKTPYLSLLGIVIIWVKMCHSFLIITLDERKVLFTKKLYQSEVKPNLLPPSIDHSLFSQLCQNKHVSDLAQRRFDQRYGLMAQLPRRKG